MTGRTPRRGFLARLAGAAVALTAAPSVSEARASSQAVPDESWLQGLSGAHKQFFDVGNFRDRVMSRVMIFLDVYGEAYGLQDANLNAVVGVHGPALGFVFNDALWSKYELGKRWSVNDPLTKAPAIRNPMVRKESAYDWGAADYSVTRLQQRGVRFIACMRSIRALSAELAGGREAAPPVNAEILANLLPGVTPVPAMIVAINRAQEAGLTYVFAG